MRIPLPSLGLIALVAGTLASNAGEPWTDKPYTEWQQQDVNRILRDSPWARTVYIPWSSSMLGVGGGHLVRLHTDFVVQWASSLTVRQAVVRQAQLAGPTPATPESEERNRALLLHTPDSFVLLVWLIPDPSHRGVIAQVQWSELAYLQPQASKQRIRALSVHKLNDSLVQLEFPRTIEGKPVLDASQRKVHFEYRVDLRLWLQNTRKIETVVETEFDLSKMVQDGKPDL